MIFFQSKFQNGMKYKKIELRIFKISTAILRRYRVHGQPMILFSIRQRSLACIDIESANLGSSRPDSSCYFFIRIVSFYKHNYLKTMTNKIII